MQVKTSPSGEFLPGYARLYDLFYADKDYDAECDFVEALLARHGGGAGPRRILDIACGTGGHALRLAARGHDVAGRDLSGAMVDEARRKARSQGLELDLAGDQPMQELALGRRFDAVICLFSAFSYLTANEDVRAALDAVERHLEPGGLFIVDFRNAFVAATDFETMRERTFERGATRVDRVSRTRLLPLESVLETRYECRVFEDGREVDAFTEIHRLRHFAIQEMRYYLAAAGLEVEELMPFLEVGRPVEPDTWNVAAVARRP